MVLQSDSLPFLKVLHNSNSQRWEGLFAVHLSLKLTQPELIPAVESSSETIAMNIGGDTHVRFWDGHREARQVSSSGYLTFFPRNHPVHTWWMTDTENINFGVTSDLLRLIASEVRSGDPEKVVLWHFGLFKDPLVTQIGWALLKLLRDERRSARLYAEALGVSLAHHLLYTYDARTQQHSLHVPTHVSNRQIRVAIDYIYANMHKNLGLAEIADNAGLSIAHFSRLFRAATGESPHKFLIRCRVERAAVLLQQRKMTVADVAQQVGFYDESHLIRQFRNIYGVSPRQFSDQV